MARAQLVNEALLVVHRELGLGAKEEALTPFSPFAAPRLIGEWTLLRNPPMFETSDYLSDRVSQCTTDAFGDEVPGASRLAASAAVICRGRTTATASPR